MSEKYVQAIKMKMNKDEIKKHNMMIMNMKSKKISTTGTQTGDFIEFYDNISKNKNIHFYYSKLYSDYVLSINFGNCKKYVINRKMWLKFQKHFTFIDYVYFNLK